MTEDERLELVDQASELIYDAIKAARDGDLEAADTLADAVIRMFEGVLSPLDAF